MRSSENYKAECKKVRNGQQRKEKITMMNVENRETANRQPEVITLADVENMSNAELMHMLSGLQFRNDNSSIIINAALNAAAEGKITLSHRDLVGMVFGVAPKYHTYDTWKSQGYIVKRGEHAAFTARIWKYTERRGEMTAEDAEAINSIISNADGSDFANEGDAVVSSRFIRKEAYFFGPDQVELLEELEELPEDCERRRENGKEIITGNTRPIKEQLKASGYRWHKKNHYWYKFVA